jgi:hypothetical protein
VTAETHKRVMFGYALRYRAGTRLARRSPTIARGRFRTAEIAERVRSHCPHAEHIEVVDIRERAAS